MELGELCPQLAEIRERLIEREGTVEGSLSPGEKEINKIDPILEKSPLPEDYLAYQGFIRQGDKAEAMRCLDLLAPNYPNLASSLAERNGDFSRAIGYITALPSDKRDPVLLRNLLEKDKRAQRAYAAKMGEIERLRQHYLQNDDLERECMEALKLEEYAKPRSDRLCHGFKKLAGYAIILGALYLGYQHINDNYFREQPAITQVQPEGGLEGKMYEAGGMELDTPRNCRYEGSNVTCWPLSKPSICKHEGDKTICWLVENLPAEKMPE